MTPTARTTLAICLTAILACAGALGMRYGGAVASSIAFTGLCIAGGIAAGLVIEFVVEEFSIWCAQRWR